MKNLKTYITRVVKRRGILDLVVQTRLAIADPIGWVTVPDSLLRNTNLIWHPDRLVLSPS